MKNDIGSKLKILRIRKGLTQDEVAHRINATRSTVSNYERGRRRPKINDLQKLAKIYGVGLDFFNISKKDEVIELVSRAKDVFTDPSVSTEKKEELYQEFMKLYLTMKGNENK